MAKSIAKKAALITAALLVLFTAGVVFELKELFSILILAVTVFFMIKFLKKHYAKAILFGVLGFMLTVANSFAYESVFKIFHPQPIQAASNFVIDGQDVPSVSPPQKYEDSSSTPNCSHSYPQNIVPWCDLIEKAALKYGLDPLLVASVIIQESGGNNHAGQTIQIVNGVEYHTSSSGAVGLMQVMPKDGISASFQCEYGPCFSSRPSIEELQNPAFNIDYGARMLSDLIQKHGDVRNALAAYGPYDVGYTYADLVMMIYAGL